jgi:hypothetical protein
VKVEAHGATPSQASAVHSERALNPDADPGSAMLRASTIWTAASVRERPLRCPSNCTWPPAELTRPADGLKPLVSIPVNRPGLPVDAFKSTASPRYQWPARPETGMKGRKIRPRLRAIGGEEVLRSPALWSAIQPPSSGMARWSTRQLPRPDALLRPPGRPSTRCEFRLPATDNAP